MKRVLNNSYQKLINSLGELRVKKDVLLAPHTTLKVGGPADLFFVAQQTDGFIKAIKAAIQLKIPCFVLGGGSNIVVSDQGWRGLVIKNRDEQIRVVGYGGKKTKEEQQGKVVVEASGGTYLQRLKRWTLEQGLEGLEFVDGIPGTVGGAVKLNVHDRHLPRERYLSDVLVEADLLDWQGEVKTVGNEYFQFDQWRQGWKTGSCLVETGETVLRARFSLKQVDPGKLWAYIEEYSAWRQEHQPQGYPSAGSFFANPRFDLSAGQLIDRAGLKGMRVGDAAVSQVHANFIVNLGSARASDVFTLANLIKREVEKKFGIHLEEEVIYVGEF